MARSLIRIITSWSFGCVYYAFPLENWNEKLFSMYSHSEVWLASSLCNCILVKYWKLVPKSMINKILQQFFHIMSKFSGSTFRYAHNHMACKNMMFLSMMILFLKTSFMLVYAYKWNCAYSGIKHNQFTR